MRRLYSAEIVCAIVGDRSMPESAFMMARKLRINSGTAIPGRRSHPSTRLPAAGAVLRLQARACRLARIFSELDTAAVADLRVDRILAPAFGTQARLALRDGDDDPADRSERRAPDEAREPAALRAADQRADRGADQRQQDRPSPERGAQQRVDARLQE